MPGWSFATSPCLTLEGLTLHIIMLYVILHVVENLIAKFWYILQYM